MSSDMAMAHGSRRFGALAWPLADGAGRSAEPRDATEPAVRV
jgi:hypothetical protein